MIKWSVSDTSRTDHFDKRTLREHVVFKILSFYIKKTRLKISPFETKTLYFSSRILLALEWQHVADDSAKAPLCSLRSLRGPFGFTPLKPKALWQSASACLEKTRPSKAGNVFTCPAEIELRPTPIDDHSWVLYGILIPAAHLHSRPRKSGPKSRIFAYSNTNSSKSFAFWVVKTTFLDVTFYSKSSDIKI